MGVGGATGLLRRPRDIVPLRATPPGPEGTPSGLRSEPDPEGTPSASGFSLAPDLAVLRVSSPGPSSLGPADLRVSPPAASSLGWKVRRVASRSSLAAATAVPP